MKLWYSYLKELKLSSKGFYFYIEILMTVIILFVLLFVIPENFDSTEDEFIVLDLPEPVYGMFMDNIREGDLDGQVEQAEFEIDDQVITADLYISDEKKIYLFDNAEDMIEATKKERPLIGATISWNTDENALKYDYYIQGYESERLRNLYSVLHVKNLETIIDDADQIEVRSLETGVEQLNSRQMALPSLITFNGSLMGLFIIAAYIFLDKQEGIIKAYAVTASKVSTYLLSKALTLMTVTLATSLIIAISVMGTQVNYPMFILLLLTSGFFASTLGLFITSFFDNLTQAFGAIYTVMMLFMLPAIAYFIPSWNPLWIQMIPIYHLILGFKETIMVGGDMTYVLISSAGFFAGGVILFLLSNYRFRGNLSV